MCGICGKLNFSSEFVSPETIRRMNSRMVHRGPDEEGVYFSPEKNLGLGIRRLKIIDLTTGSQPVYNETKEIVVILNGEIYNYLELREELEKKGHKFYTNSDTETIAHAYELYGRDFLNRLNGMFALALWDEKKKILILARDRMGIKPLYYRQDESTISFASEIKSLLTEPECSKEIDPFALDDYFSLLYVPGPRTIFKSIKKLPPAHYLFCDLRKKTIESNRYWKKSLVIDSPDLGWDFYREQLDFLLKDSIRLQLRCDVPNGIFLSSGLDSGTIAYYATQLSSQRIKTFTIHFAEESYSEQEGARQIAQRFNSEHFEIMLEPDIERLILKTINFFDEPFADSSAIPTFLLCEFARKEVTVALSGEGGDELFAGYPTYLATKFATYYKEVPAIFKKILKTAVENLPVSWDRISGEYQLKRFLQGAELPAERTHFSWKEIFTEEEKRSLFSSEFLKEKGGHDGFGSFQILFESVGNGIELEKLLFVDQNSYLLDEFLVKSDRMSMANSLEVRVPLLDHRIVELASKIPSRYKISGFKTKWALRKLMEGRLPKEILSARKKGFSPPIPSWIAGTLKPFLMETLSESCLKKVGFLRHDYLQQLMEEHFQKRRDHHRQLWAALNFVLWYQRWIG